MAKDVKYFSNCFIKECGSSELQFGKDINKINVYFMIEPISDDELKKLINEQSIIKNTAFKKVKFKLLNINEASFNKDTLEESNHTYQELLNESVLKYIFTTKITYNDGTGKYDASKDIAIRTALDYPSAQQYYNESKNDNENEYKYRSLLNDYGINFNEYNIKEGNYRSSEFINLGIKEKTIIENEIILKCDDLQYFENSENSEHVLKYGIYGFLLTYSKNDNDEIPMLVYKFANCTYSNYNKIKLVFNANGLFGVV